MLMVRPEGCSVALSASLLPAPIRLTACIKLCLLSHATGRCK
ncbi:hypothetical protein M3J09_002570 [Ascochyta lentis]